MLSAAVVPKTDCSSARVLCHCGGLGSSLLLCLVVELWLVSQQPPSRLVSTAASLLFRFYGFLRCNRPGVFSGLVLLNSLLYLLLFLCCCSSRDFLTCPHLIFQLGRFQSLCGFPRHLLYRSKPRTDVIHSTPSLRGRGFHIRRIRRRRHLVHESHDVRVARRDPLALRSFC